MMSDHDPIDDVVRAARPSAPARLAPAIAARMASRRNVRRAAIAATAVLAAAAAVLLWMQHSPERPGPGPIAAATGAPLVRDASVGSSAAPPPDAAPAGWSDMPALLAELERTHHAAIARCVPAARVTVMATFRIARQPDGTSRTDLVIHHSLGYLGYSDEERCLQRVATAIDLPPLPEAIWSIAFTLAPPATSAATTTWSDPLDASGALLATVRPQIETCVLNARVPRPQRAVAVFEPSGGPYRGPATSARARIVLDNRSPNAMRKCVARIARALDVPVLPEHIDQIIVALPIGEP